MKRINFLALTAAAVLSLSAVSCNMSASVSSSVPEDRSGEWKALEQPLNFYIANDLGRNGYYDQKPIAETMGRMAETIDIEFVVAAGDVHHFEGVQSVSDPLWMTNYELIYSHPDLMTPWYAICGNHEYRSNTQACIDYPLRLSTSTARRPTSMPTLPGPTATSSLHGWTKPCRRRMRIG